MDIEACAYER